MKNNQASRNIVMLTALAAVIIIAASWFLLISPVLASASEASEQAVQQEDANENTQVQVNKLKKQYAEMPQYEAQLTELQVQIPPTQMYAELQRMFADVAAKRNVVITSLEFGTATMLEQQKVAEDDAATEEDPTAEEEPATEEDPAAEQPAAGDDGNSANANKSELYSIPVTLTIEGKYDDVLSALNDLQTGANRIVLVTGVELAPSTEPDAEEGTTTATFTSETFVLTGTGLTEETPVEGETDGSSPSPSPEPSN
ncbi:hypothetical protein [Demequina sp.]|uniref:hypothetical protein n=1 Tax=Demequina sp. TaxID=2050685 RepID=UPI003D0A2C4C